MDLRTWWDFLIRLLIFRFCCVHPIRFPRNWRSASARRAYVFSIGDAAVSFDNLTPLTYETRGAFGWRTCRSFRDITDGTTNTVFMSERAVGITGSRRVQDLMASVVEDGILDRINHEMSRKFPGNVRQLGKPSQDDVFWAYCYLLKRLSFATKFDKLDEPLPFQTSDGLRPVKSFGIKNSLAEEAFRGQVEVLDYVSEDDFLVRLKTRSDDVILSKIAPMQTLGEMIESVKLRSRPGTGIDVVRDCDRASCSSFLTFRPTLTASSPSLSAGNWPIRGGLETSSRTRDRL